MPTVQQGGYIDVDDVPVLQRLVRRDPVAHDMVDRDAAGVGVAAIAKRRGHGAAVQHHLAHCAIKLCGADAGDDERGQGIEDLGRQPASLAHALEPFGPVQLDRSVAIDGLARLYVLIFHHARECSEWGGQLREAKLSRYSGLTASSTAWSMRKFTS
jgi:hypothetical protein